MGGNNPAVTIIHRAKTPNRLRGRRKGILSLLSCVGLCQKVQIYSANEHGAVENSGCDAKIQHLLLNCTQNEPYHMAHGRAGYLYIYIYLYEYRIL